jgi:hypothetical protein
MLYREIIAFCSQIHTKHINTLCGQNVELLTATPGGTYNDHLKGLNLGYKTSQLMLYREMIAVCSQIHTKHINTLCGQNVELLNVKPGLHIVTKRFLSVTNLNCSNTRHSVCGTKGLAGFEPTGQRSQVLERVTATVTSSPCYLPVAACDVCPTDLLILGVDGIQFSDIMTPNSLQGPSCSLVDLQNQTARLHESRK